MHTLHQIKYGLHEKCHFNWKVVKNLMHSLLHKLVEIFKQSNFLNTNNVQFAKIIYLNTLL